MREREGGDGEAQLGRANERKEMGRARDRRSWAERRRGGAGPIGQKRIFHIYFILKTKFNFEPNANSNRVSNIHFNPNKNEKFW